MCSDVMEKNGGSGMSTFVSTLRSHWLKSCACHGTHFCLGDLCTEVWPSINGLSLSHLHPVHKPHFSGLSVFSGSCWRGWHWIGLSLYPLLPTSPWTLPILPLSPSLPWILPQHLVRADSSCFPPLILGLQERFLEPAIASGHWVSLPDHRIPRMADPPNWKHHHYVFKKCFTWKYLIACSTKISSPKPQGWQVWMYEGCRGNACAWVADSTHWTMALHAEASILTQLQKRLVFSVFFGMGKQIENWSDLHLSFSGLFS